MDPLASVNQLVTDIAAALARFVGKVVVDPADVIPEGSVAVTTAGLTALSTSLGGIKTTIDGILPEE